MKCYTNFEMGHKLSTNNNVCAHMYGPELLQWMATPSF